MKHPATTIGEALRIGRGRLARAGSDTPGLDAEVLLRHVLGLGRAGLFAQFPDAIAPDAQTAYQRLLDQRASGTPVAYLTGEREFMGLTFAVGPEVLIPRPESEILVEWALNWLSQRKHATIVDVGTGSGAIALSLAALLDPGVAGAIIAIDVSDAALAMAARNRARFGLEEQVTLMQGSLLAPISGSVDLLLANLPYLTPEQIAVNPELAAEPRLALDGGADGLGLVRQLIGDAPRVMGAGGAIGLEIDPSQAEAVVARARDAFPAADVAVLSDLAGRDRHVIVSLG